MELTVEELENDIKQLDLDIANGEALVSLKNNKDFKKLILNGFLQEYVLNVLYKNNEIDYTKLESAKTLNDYFDSIENAAKLAETNKTEYIKEYNSIK